MKRIFRIGLKVLAIFFGSILVTGLCVQFFFADEVKSFALQQVQAQLKSKMNIGKVDFSLWRHFPRASVDLNDVLIEDTFGLGDTLLYADRLSLAFNIIDLFAGNYTVNYIGAEAAIINLKIKSDGTDNYHFWNEATDSLPPKNFRFHIQELELEDSKINYSDLQNDVFISSDLGDVGLEGSFSEEIKKIGIQGNLELRRLQLAGSSYLKGEELEIDAELEISENGNRIRISNTDLELRGTEVRLDGNWNNGRANINIRTSSANKNILYAILPDLMSKMEADYLLEGIFSFDGAYTGKGSAQRLTGQIELSGAQLQHKESGERLSGIQSTAELNSTQDKTSIRLFETTGKFRNGKVQVAGTFEFTEQTYMDIQLVADIELEEAKEFFALDTLEQFSGSLTADIKYKGFIDKEGWSAQNLREAEINGRLVLKEAQFKLKGNKNTLSNLAATFVLIDGNAAVQGLSASIGSNSFEAEGMMRNLLPYLLDPTATLTIETSFKSERIDLVEFLSEEQSSDGNSFALKMPENVNCNLNLQLKELRFKEFVASDVEGIVRLFNGELRMHPVSFKTAGGVFLADFTLRKKANSEHFTLICEAAMQKIDIRELFRQFDNFGQRFITDVHLKGKTNAHIAFRSSMRNDLSIDAGSIESMIDLTIENGELIGLESLQKISEYLRNNKLISTFADPNEFDDKMKHIQFKTLHNQIEIKNKIIYIPTMDIQSNAMDISASGKHGFDNTIDYSLNFRIRDLLRKKQSEFGEEIDDGLGGRFFLAMFGTTTNPEFKYDKDAQREKRREDLKTEKEEFKQLLKDEFGFFKKADKGEEKTGIEKGSGTNMTITWEEDTLGNSKNKPATKESPKPKEEKKKGWLDRLIKDEEQEKDKVKIDIEEED